MRASTFIVLAVLVMAIAFCQAQETTRQTRLRYALSRAERQEAELRRSLEDWRTRETRLSGASRLLALNREMPRPLEPMRPWKGPVLPEPPVHGNPAHGYTVHGYTAYGRPEPLAHGYTAHGGPEPHG